MSTLLVIGAADGARRAYRVIAERGWRSVAVDRDPDAAAVPLADRYVQASTGDPAAILRAVRQLDPRDRPTGVLAPASDLGLSAAFAVAEALGLPTGLTAEAIRASQDKAWLTEQCRIRGVPVPGGVSGQPGPKLTAAICALPGPWVVKPLDAQSSRGLTRGVLVAQLAHAVEHARRHSRSGQVVAETEVLGRHLTAECVVVQGRVAFSGLSERRLTPAPLAVTTAHAMDEALDADLGAEARDLMNAVCSLTGYRWGALTADLVLAPAGPMMLVEVGMRTGGDPLGELCRLSYGVDTVAASVALAAGRTPDLTHSPRRAAVAEILQGQRSGVLRSVSGWPSAGGPARVDLCVRQGQHLRPMTTLADKWGSVLATGPSIEHARAAARSAAESLRFELAHPVSEVAG